MIGVFIKRGNLDTEMHPGRMACEDRGDVAEAKECQRLPVNHQKLGERLQQILPLGLQEEPTLPRP